MKTSFKKLIKTLGKKTMDDIIKEVSKYPIVSLKSQKKLTTKKMIIEILNQYETMTCADILYHIVNGYKIKTTKRGT